jgi:hypothetical protein
MKRSFTLFSVLVLFAGLTLTGCKKECDEATNLLTVGKTTVELKNFAFYRNSQTTNGYEYYVELLEDGISFDQNGYFVGSGSYLEMKVISSSGDGIASGEYVFDNSGSFPVLTFFAAKHCLGWNESTSNTSILINSGTLEVTRDNSNYEISFSGTDSEGKKVTAYYKGSSIFFDWSSTKSSSAPGK